MDTLGIEFMGRENKGTRIRRCAACSVTVGIKAKRCPECGGPTIGMGPIEWTEEDEIEAGKEFVGTMEDMEAEEEDFQDTVCFLWDMIEEGEEQIIDQAAEIEELKAEVVITKNAVKMVDEKVKELEAKLADKTITGKVKKAFGSE